jgi:uncharacterized membrane protein YhhN
MLELLFARGDGWDFIRLSLTAISLAVSIAYLGIVNGSAGPLRTTVKTAAVAILTFLPLTYLSIPGAGATALVILALALGLSALGDFLLALKDQTRFFVAGLGAFLLAHVAYVATCLPLATMPSGGALTTIIFAILAAGALLTVLNPKLGRLRWPVHAYFAVIMMMVATALSIAEAPWFLGAGAVTFALSDSLIAIRRFQGPLPYNNEAVWITYIAAQFMLTAGLLKLLIPAQVV